MNPSKKYNKENTKSTLLTIQNNIADQITDPHKFTIKTLSAFAKIIKKFTILQKSKSLPINDLTITQSLYRGRLVCRNEGCFHITVSEALVNRAIRFTNDLAIELENKKFKIKFIHDAAGGVVVAIKDNEHISFHISEGYKYQPIKNELRSELERLLFRDKKPVPTNKLTLTIVAIETHISKSWSDGKRQIEDALPLIIKSFESLGLRQKQRRIDNVLKADKYRAKSKIFCEIESRKYAEKSIYEDAMKEAHTFIAHRELEAYLNQLELKCLNECAILNEATRSWLSTIRKFAEAQNPISRRLKILNEL